jgi:hypothetical protein
LVGSYGVNTARFESVVLPILEKAKKSKGPLRSHGRGWKDGAVF